MTLELRGRVGKRESVTNLLLDPHAGNGAPGLPRFGPGRAAWPGRVAIGRAGRPGRAAVRHSARPSARSGTVTGFKPDAARQLRRGGALVSLAARVLVAVGRWRHWRPWVGVGVGGPVSLGTRRRPGGGRVRGRRSAGYRGGWGRRVLSSVSLAPGWRLGRLAARSGRRSDSTGRPW